MRIAVLGGSFDPVHSDHLWIARDCLQKWGFEQVWFLPNYQNPDKCHHQPTEIKHRIAMLQLAIKNHLGVKICLLETTPGVHLTFQTLRQLRQLHPNDQFTFIIGQDLLANIEQWDNFSEIITYHPILVLQRGLILTSAEHSVIQRFNMQLCKFHHAQLSSTAIREGSKYDHQLKRIHNYINHHLLYIKDRLLGARVAPKRQAHSLAVADTARKLAKRYQICPTRAYLAGAFHDITKNWSAQEQQLWARKFIPKNALQKKHPNVYHAYTGYLYLKWQLHINDPYILQAVRYHTNGCSFQPHWLIFIVLIADKTSSDRHYPQVAFFRHLSRVNLVYCYYLLLQRMVQLHRSPWLVNSQLWQNYCYWNNIIFNNQYT